jgi:hypothetical protein
MTGEEQHTALTASSRPPPKEEAINPQPLLFEDPEMYCKYSKMMSKDIRLRGGSDIVD